MSNKKAAHIANANNPDKKGAKHKKYEKWSREELHDRAESAGIEEPSEMNKDELVDALRNHKSEK